MASRISPSPASPCLAVVHVLVALRRDLWRATRCETAIRTNPTCRIRRSTPSRLARPGRRDICHAVTDTPSPHEHTRIRSSAPTTATPSSTTTSGCATRTATTPAHYLEAENAYTDSDDCRPRGPARGDLRRDQGAHAGDGPVRAEPIRRLWYYQRTTEGLQYPVRLPHQGGGATTGPRRCSSPGWSIAGEEILVDCNDLADGQEFFRLGAFSVTLDEQLLAYSTDLVGDERYTIVVKDLRTGDLLPDRIADTARRRHLVRRSARHLFYSTVDDAWRPGQDLATRARHGQQRRRRGAPRDRRPVLDVHHAYDVRPLPADPSRTRKITSEWRLLDAETRQVSSRSSSRARAASSTTSSTP